MVRKYFAIIILTLALLGITVHPALIGIARVSPLWAKGFSYQAEIINISGEKYFPAVKGALEKAEKSIYLAMFTIQLPEPVNEKSKVSQLIDTLIAARNRGVEVEVILDQNVDFVHRGHFSDWDVEIKSTRAYQRLRDAGIRVYYDEPARYTHCKTVIIDKKIVILGSTNWSESSFTNSIETDVAIDSAGLADEILRYLKTIKIDESVNDYLDNTGEATRIGEELLKNPRFMPQMVKAHAERELDLYLYLLWKFDDKNRDSPQKAGTVPIFQRVDGEKGGVFIFQEMAKYLGIYQGSRITDYRRQIIRALRNLEKNYKLIRFKPSWGKEAEIALVEKRGQSQSSGQSPFFQKAAVPISNDYFEFGWNKELSLRAKFCLLINLYYFQASDVKPFWSKSTFDITKEFGGISRYVIIKGMEELRRKKLLEVKYDELTEGKPFNIKSPKMYKLLKLYNPKELLAELKTLEDKYGLEAYGKARKYAEIVFEENNPRIIEDIILKTKESGEERIKKAFDIVARKNTDNPKKSYAYVVGIITNR